MGSDEENTRAEEDEDIKIYVNQPSNINNNKKKLSHHSEQSKASHRSKSLGDQQRAYCNE